MIKIFRQIRRQLIGEGKTGKYFKYAIGEIVLVVIGILIALQVNNWNEQRKQNKQERYIIEQLQTEFKADSIMLARMIMLTSDKINAVNFMIKSITEQKIDSIKLPAVFFSGKSIPFYDYSPTYNELVSAGNLNLISNDSIKNAINIFINHNALLESSIYLDMMQKKSDYMNHVYKYFNGEINGLLWDRSKTLEELEVLGADFAGFANDPSTIYNLNKILAADSEYLFISKTNISRRLNNVLELLNREVENYD